MTLSEKGEQNKINIEQYREMPWNPSRRTTIWREKNTVNKGTVTPALGFRNSDVMNTFIIFGSCSLSAQWYQADSSIIIIIMFLMFGYFSPIHTHFLFDHVCTKQKESQSTKERLSAYHMHHSHQTKWNEMRINNNNFFPSTIFVVSFFRHLFALNAIIRMIHTYAKCRSRFAQIEKISSKTLGTLFDCVVGFVGWHPF